ncbi:MAG: hypothetical protein K2Y27_14385 [Xanthobacteraceae bacterium]|nr:hypothetical protein [Xanthobacteraceae bacterium]
MPVRLELIAANVAQQHPELGSPSPTFVERADKSVATLDEIVTVMLGILPHDGDAMVLAAAANEQP